MNATQAAIRAGYSKRTAARMGSENLHKPPIASRIAELVGERSWLSALAHTASGTLHTLQQIVIDAMRHLLSEG